MANYTSQPLEVAPVTSSFNFDLIDKVQAVQQQKYDTAKSNINSAIAQLGAMQLARPQDREYLEQRKQMMINSINEMPHKNLANSNVADSYYSVIKDVARDPYILSAIENTAKIQNFEAQMTQLREKNMDAYSNENYQDALEQAGYFQYMSGEIDKINNIAYQEYVNVNMNLNNRAKEYAKEMGFERYIGTEDGGYYYLDKTGRKVTEQEIFNHLENSLDSKEKTQLQINARQTIGKMPEQELNNYIKEYTTKQNNNLKKVLAREQARVATMSEEDKAEMMPIINQIKEQIKDNDVKIEQGQFDKNQIYGIYTNSLLRNIASSYEIDAITKVDRDKLPLEVMKYHLQVRKVEAAEKANEIAESATLGTPTTVPDDSDDSGRTKYDRLVDEVVSTQTALEAYLAANNVGGFADMNEEERWEFIQNYNPGDPTVPGNTVEVAGLVESFQSAQKAQASIIANSEEELRKITTKKYDEIRRGDAKINNLASTMPLTARFIGENRNTSFNNLPEEVRIGIMAEMVANNIQYDDKLDQRLVKIYGDVVTRLKSNLDSKGTDLATETLQTIERSSRTTPVGGFLMNAVRGLAAEVGVAKNVLDINIVNPLLRNIEAVLFSPEYAEQREVERTMGDALDLRGYMGMQRATRDYVRDIIGKEDTNITELEVQDLRTADGSVPVDALAEFRDVGENIISSTEAMANNFLPELRSMTAYTFSTTSKEQAPTATALRASIATAEGDNMAPVTTNDFTVRRDGEGYEISYIGLKNQYKRVYVDDVPPLVKQAIQTSESNWHNNPRNPNITLTPITVAPITDPKKSRYNLQTVYENTAGAIPQSEFESMMSNPSNTPFASTSDYMTWAEKTYGKTFYNNNAQAINNILNQEYTITPYTDGNKFYLEVLYTENGLRKARTVPTNLTEKDNTTFYIAALNQAHLLKRELIRNLTEDGRN